MNNHASYHFFDTFRLDPVARELWQGDTLLSVPPRIFEGLVYLIENRDRAVGRDELISALWGRVDVADRQVTQLIRHLRQVIGQQDDEESQAIRTIYGFGYRWVTPVEIVEITKQAAPGDTRRPAWHWLAAAILMMGVLATGMLYLWRDSEPNQLNMPGLAVNEGDIALLLPVTVDGKTGDGDAWMRLGLMDLIAERLRAAGQPVVSNDTVIALMRSLSAEPTADDLDALSATTRAGLVLGARVQLMDSGWRVTVRSFNGARWLMLALSESEDVLEAARTAADNVALSLGQTPAPTRDAEPGLELLEQQITAALRAEQRDVARELIAAADGELRALPEIRFQQARLDYYDHNLDAAEASFERLLEEPSVERDPALRARVLTGLGGVRYTRGEYDAAQRFLEEAANLHAREARPERLGEAWNNLGLVASRRGDLEAAKKYLARAREPLESAGAVQLLANLELNHGVLQALLDRTHEALLHYENAAGRFAALHDLGSELRTRVNVINTRLSLLDIPGAVADEERLSELIAISENPDIIAYAQLTRASLFFAVGRLQDGDAVLDELLESTEGQDGLKPRRLDALALRAARAAQQGDMEQAARAASEVVAGMPRNDAVGAVAVAETWRALIRAELTLGRLASAAGAVAELRAWAERGTTAAPRVFAALARAELAAAESRTDDARDAFEQALALADTGHTPKRLLEVAEAYVPWLLADGPGRDPERAGVVTDQITLYAGHDYQAALLQLRLYHALGSHAAWRAALGRVTALAGERRIPPELLSAPDSEPKLSIF